MSVLHPHILRIAAQNFFNVAVVVLSFAWMSQTLNRLPLLANTDNPLNVLAVSSLALPTLSSHLLPMAFAVSLVLTCRTLAAERQLVALASLGAGPWSVAKPFLFLAFALSAFLLILNSYAAPVSRKTMDKLVVELRTQTLSLSAQERVFASPAPNVTFFIHEQSAPGRFRGLLVQDNRPENPRSLTYAAEDAVFVQTPEGPLLVMFNGSIQARHRSNKKPLVLATFSKFTFDLSTLLGETQTPRLSASKQFLHELFGSQSRAQTKKQSQQFVINAHARIARALSPIALALLVLAFALSPRSSGRRPHSSPYALAVILSVASSVLFFAAERLAAANPNALPLIHFFPLAVAASSAFALQQHSLPKRPKRPNVHSPPQTPPPTPPHTHA